MLFAKRVFINRITTSAQSIARKQVPKSQPVLIDEAMIKVMDTNTLLATRSTPYSAISTLTWIIPAGSKWETIEQVGYATALKHALFTSNKYESALALARKNELKGTQLSTSINRDILMIQATFPNSSPLTESMETLSNMVLGFEADHYELDRVRERLSFEWQQSRINVDALLDDAIHMAAYKSHPYGNPLISNPEYIELSSEGLKPYLHAALKRSNNSIIGIGVDHEHLIALQKALVMNIKSEHPRVLHTDSNAYQGLGEERVESSLQDIGILIAFEAPSLTSPDYAVSLILNALLGGHHAFGPHIDRAQLFGHDSRNLGCLNVVPYSAIHSQSALFGIKFIFGNNSSFNDMKQCIEKTFARIKNNIKDIKEEQLTRAKQMALLKYAEELDERDSSILQFSHQLYSSNTLTEIHALKNILSKFAVDHVKRISERIFSGEPSMASVSSNLRKVPNLLDLKSLQ